MFSEDILEAADGELILGISVGPFGWSSDADDTDAYAYNRISEQVPLMPASMKNVVLPWAEVEPYLRYEYDGGYGAPECHNIIAWTVSKVIFVHEYDGATSLRSMPRNPSNFVAPEGSWGSW